MSAQTNKSLKEIGRKRQPTRSSVHQNQEENNLDGISSTKFLIYALAFGCLLVGIYIQLAKNLNESFKRFSLSPLSVSQNANQFSDLSKSKPQSVNDQTLVVAENMGAGYLDHIIDTLLRFDHKLTFSNSVTESQANRGDLQQYNLIWTHDYPFNSIKKLLPYQRLNHFPGTGFITNKLTLSTTPRIPHILKAFRTPHDKDKFFEYSKSHPEKKLWIQKSSSHRGINIVSVENVNFTLNDTLVQEYMSNPLLVDGKKFDIGIYAVLTSVEPLRVYIYESEVLIRFCAKQYLDPTTGKFNASDLDSYVVGDDYTPIWLMPSLLRFYIGTNLSMKQTLNTFLRSKLNKNGLKIWQQIEDTIISVYKAKEHHLARMTRMYQAANNYKDTSVKGSLNQFFELVRFDFIVDEELNVFLMEANMSPNLSSRHFPPNRLLYEQVLNSYFSLVGLNTFARQHLSSATLPVQYLDEEDKEELVNNSGVSNSDGLKRGLEELVSEKELSVYEELCVSDECHMNCDKSDCMMCYFCLNDQDKLHLRRAIYEQYSRWNFKRLLPSTRDEDLQLQLQQPDQLPNGPRKGSPHIDSNFVHVQWFRGKCYSDKRFCTY